MTTQDIQIEEIPHGHGSSFKKGVSDGVLNENNFKEKLPHGHKSSYEKGLTFGKYLQDIITKKIK